MVAPVYSRCLMAVRVGVVLLLIALVVSFSLQWPTSTQLQPPLVPAERLENYEALLGRLEKTHQGKPVKDWPETPRQLWHDTEAARREFLENHPELRTR